MSIHSSMRQPLRKSVRGWAVSTIVLAAFGIVASVPALAVLKAGDHAPDFHTEASLGGEVFQFALADALKKGPVVLYFYPAAFTPGCTIEAHEFAEATDQFKALGATVIGISTDDIETLKKFSVSECRSKFAVAADADKSITKAYDSVHPLKSTYASRTSYVITPDASIIYAYSDGSPSKHVENTLAALKQWRAGSK